VSNEMVQIGKKEKKSKTKRTLGRKLKTRLNKKNVMKKITFPHPLSQCKAEKYAYPQQ
jgi:hypothetical protein